MLCNIWKCPSSRFFDSRIELFKANNKGLKSSWIYNSFSKLSGMFSNCPKNKSCSFFIEPLKIKIKCTFCSFSDITSWGNISLLTTLSASYSFILASRPRARAALCEIDGTLSKRSGLSKLMTPADWRASIFWGLVANSAIVCTNVTLAFWYC